MSHVPGKQFITADTLSQAPVPNATIDDIQLLTQLSEMGQLVSNASRRLKNVRTKMRYAALNLILPGRMAK